MHRLLSTHLPLALTAGLAAAIAGAGTASAQEAQAEAGLHRTGATFGASLGGGHLGCSNRDGEDCDGDGPVEAAGLTLHAGFTLNPNLALIGELWGAAHQDDRVTVSQGIATAALRFWPAPRIWLQGGLGVARTTVSYDADVVEFEDESEVVPALVAAVGVEVISTRDFGLDVQLRGGTGYYDDDTNIYAVTLGVGVAAY